MLSPKKTSVLFSFLLLTASIARPAALFVNSACAGVTSCTPGTLAPGQSIPTTSFSFDFTAANSDKFAISGTYSADGTAPDISFAAEAVYLGNSTDTASKRDEVTVDLLQDFKYNGTPDGTYSFSATLNQHDVAPGSTVSADLFFGPFSIGVLGPIIYAGTPQSETLSASKDLSFSDTNSPTIRSDFNYTFFLESGSPAALGAGTVPEPASVALGSLGTGLLTLLLVCRKKSATLSNR